MERPNQNSWSLALALACIGAGVGHAQEEVSATRTVQLPGVELRVDSALADDALADALETYARRLRSRKDDDREDEPALAAPLPAAPAEPGEDGATWTLFPRSLLWQPPYANQAEPHSFVKASTLEFNGRRPVNDIGIGGTLSVVRWSPADPDDGVQLDMFSFVLSRFVETDLATAHDFRVGLPLTFARGPLSGKIAYEHTSTHLGDEFAERFGLRYRPSVREELVLGLAYRVLEPVRVYGIVGHVWGQTFDGDQDYLRYDVGAEWSRPIATGWWGQPFAALDLELRGDEDYTPNFTAQAGWQWLAEGARPGIRMVLEYYDGRSPFGQFLDRHESWLAVTVYFDF
jgi:hypothetical protein